METIIPCRFRKISDVFDAFPLATGVDTKNKIQISNLKIQKDHLHKITFE